MLLSPERMPDIIFFNTGSVCNGTEEMTHHTIQVTGFLIRLSVE